MTVVATNEFKLNVGVNPGYHHDNEVLNAVKIVSELWQKHAEELYQVKQVFIAGMVSLAKTVYRQECGCPLGGEDTVVICGLRNVEFCANEQLWKDCVTEVSIRVAKELQQTTAYLTFTIVGFICLN